MIDWEQRMPRRRMFTMEQTVHVDTSKLGTNFYRWASKATENDMF